MQLLSSTLSLTRYRVEGKLAEPVMDTVREGLKNQVIRDIDNDPAAKSIGWTESGRPFAPDFEKAQFMFGTYMVFSLRIDKKSVPAKIVNKHLSMAVARRLAETEQKQLSKTEKRQIKDEVTNRLYTRVPASPNVYDLVWDYEAGALWFFSNLKEANEEIETLFAKSFRLSLIRMFPYTEADLACGLSDKQRDAVKQAGPAAFITGGAHA
ncbi:MAG: recombination-associated protein RdgC [Desulfobacteraceae bacterium]|nr:recombination-associated protein RdgC [Desulfobacteraceae bacterium]MCF8095939.1 recombination-associated protein RdgC [Desulfobacteraceae bacterium]